MGDTQTEPIDLISTRAFAAGHPWEQYAWLRHHNPVYRHALPDGGWFWAVTRHADVMAVSRQPKLFSSYARGVMVGDVEDAELAAHRQMMLTMDPPQHERFRRLVSRGFTPRQAQVLKDRIDALSAEIVGAVAERGECDLVTEVAGRLPSGLIAELMGIPRADGERLYDLTEIMHTTDSEAVPPEARAAATAEMLAYADQVARDKRARPADDIATTLVQAEIDGDGLTDLEFGWFFLLLVNAGGDTTRNLVSSGVDLLFRHPDERARLQGDLDGLLPSAVEEMLRYTSPVSHFRRTATEDTVIGDQAVTAGDMVVVFYGSANRDEAVFADPDRFDVARTPNPHVAFGGGGAHLCLGMHVARIEIASLLRELLTRLPDLAPAGEPEYLRSSFITGYKHLPVRWTPA